MDRKIIEELYWVEEELDERRSSLRFNEKSRPLRFFRYITILGIIIGIARIIAGIVTCTELDDAIIFLLSSTFMCILYTLMIKGSIWSLRKRIKFLEDKKRALLEMHSGKSMKG